MTNESKKQRICPDCGSGDVVSGISVRQTAEASDIGLNYKALGILRGTVPMYADLCRQCGTIVRFFVREKDKPWIKNDF